MPRCLMSVHGSAERNEFGDYASKEDTLQGVAVRPFQTEESFKALLES